MAPIEALRAEGVPNPEAAKKEVMPKEQALTPVRRHCFTVAIANGMSATSTVSFGKVPANAVIASQSLLHSTGILGLTDVDFGTPDDPDCLADGITLAAAGEQKVTGAIPLASKPMPLWKVSGLAKDPHGELELVMTFNTAATASGALTLELLFAVQ